MVATRPPSQRASEFARAAPNVARQSPVTVGNIATSSIPDEQLVTVARDAELANFTTKARTYWDSISEEEKHRYWKSLSETERMLLNHEGIEPPPDNSLLRRGLTALRAVQMYNPFTLAGKGIIEGFNKFERAKDHYIRANLAMAEERGTISRDVPVLGAVSNAIQGLLPGTLSVAKWQKYWRDTEDGNESYWQSALDSVRNMGFEGEQYVWLQSIASKLESSGGRPTLEQIQNAIQQEVIEQVEDEELLPEEANQVIQQLDKWAQDENFREAVFTLAANKLNIGNATALGMGLTPGTSGFQLVSGAANAAEAFIDPFLAAGKATKILRARRFGVKSQMDVIAHTLTAEGRRRLLFDEARKLVASGGKSAERVADDAAELIRNNPELVTPAVRRANEEVAGLMNNIIDARIDFLNNKTAMNGLTGAARQEAAEKMAASAQEYHSAIAQFLESNPKYQSILRTLTDNILEFTSSEKALGKYIQLSDDGTEVIRAGTVDSADVFRFFSSEIGTNTIISGRAAGHVRNVPTIPFVAATHIPLRASKSMMKARIDWMADSPTRMWEKLREAGKITDQQWDEVAANIGNDLTEGGFLQRVWRISSGRVRVGDDVIQVNPLTTMLAAGSQTLGRIGKMGATLAPRQVIDLNSDDAIVSVGRIASFLPKAEAEKYVSMFAAQTETAERMQVVRSLFESIFTDAGLMGAGATEEAAEWASKFLDDMSNQVKRVYGLDGIDKITMASGKERAAAIHLSQTSTMLAMPDLKLLMGYAKRANFWHNLTGARMFNAGFWDIAVGRLWAPSVLLRLGFPIRAGGDEAIQFALREGGVSWVKARLVHSQGKAILKAQNQEADVAKRFVNSVAEAARKVMPEEQYDKLAARIRKGDSASVASANRMTKFIKWTQSKYRPAIIKAFRIEKDLDTYMRVLRQMDQATDSFVSRAMNDVSAQQAGFMRHVQHLDEAEKQRILDDVERPESIFDEERLARSWEEAEVAKGNDEAFQFIHNRLAALVGRYGQEAADTKIALRVMATQMQEDIAEVVATAQRNGIHPFVAFWEHVNSPQFAARFNRAWIDQVKLDPQLTKTITANLLRSRHISGNKVYIGTDSVESFLGQAKEGGRAIVSPGAAIQDVDGVLMDHLGVGGTGVSASPAPGIRIINDEGARIVANESLPEGSQLVTIEVGERLKTLDIRQVDRNEWVSHIRSNLTEDQNSIRYLDENGVDTTVILPTAALDEAEVIKVVDIAEARSVLDRWATLDEALESTASATMKSIIQRTFSYTDTSKAAVPMPGVWKSLLDGDVPDVDALKGMHFGDNMKTDLEEFFGITVDDWKELEGQVHIGMPRTFGPVKTTFSEMPNSEKVGRLYSRLIEKPFEMVGRAIDYISREPMFVHFLVKAEKEFAPALWSNRPLVKQFLDEYREATGFETAQDGLNWLKDLTNDVKEGGFKHQLEEEARKRIDVWEERIDEIATILKGSPGPEEAQRLSNELAELRATKAEYEQVLGPKGQGLDEFLEHSSRGQMLEPDLAVQQMQDFLATADDNISRVGAQLDEAKAEQVALKQLEAESIGLVEKIEAVARGIEKGAITVDEAILNSSMGKRLYNIARNQLNEEELVNLSPASIIERALERAGKAEREVFEVIFQYAVNNTLPHVDSVPVASFMAIAGRNMVPFWWAEERFLKRLAQTMFHSPESMKKLHLTYQGLRHSGFIKRDERSGDDYFIYPGSALVHEGISRMLGPDYRVPHVQQVTGKTLFSLPGLDQLGRPQLGPMVAVPMRMVAERFPSLEAFTDAAIGDYAASDAISNIDLLMPSAITRVWKAMDADRAKEHYASAHLQAIQTLTAAGFDAEEEPEEFLTKAKNLTHIIAWQRAIYGFAGFTPPSIRFDEASDLGVELQQLTETLGFEEGIERWLKKYPNATPYSVFRTETDSGASIPAADETVTFLKEHGSVLENYQMAAAYLIPRPLSSSKNYTKAWDVQTEYDLRQYRDDDEFYRAIKFAQFAPEYFERRERFESLKARYKGTAMVQELQHRWSQYTSWVKENQPTFWDELTSSDRAEKRRNIIRQLDAARTDPSVPITDASRAIYQALDAFKMYEAAMGQIAGYRGKEFTAARNNIRARFIGHMESMSDAYPWVESFYTRVLRPEALISEEQAQQLMAGAV